MIYGPQRASLDDFDSIIELADMGFSGERDRGGMLARWPHCYIRDAEFMKNILIMKDDSKVVSMVEYVDQISLVNGEEVKTAGITAVATWPTYRGRGFMTGLLKRCVSLMEEEGYAFSDLGGDRLRYGRYGWENAGRAWRFDITKRSFSAVDTPSGVSVVPYQASDEEIESVMAIHEREPIRLKRSQLLYKILLGRLGKHVWLAKGKEGITAYVITESAERRQTIVEFGGRTEDIHSIFAHFMESSDTQHIHIRSPWSHPLNSLLFRISTRWNLGTIRMIKIVDLQATLRGFARQLGSRYNALGMEGSRSVVLGISHTDQQVEVAFSPEGVTVKESATSGNAISLSDREMVRFVFGTGSPGSVIGLPQNLKFLDALLPVDFYLWPNETV
ncbi:GNAT family N-acetyltransferase [Candidatus Poribacteria bacterium]